MKFWQMLVVLVTLGGAMPTTAQDTPAVMDGFPPSTESQEPRRIIGIGPTVSGRFKILVHRIIRSWFQGVVRFTISREKSLG